MTIAPGNNEATYLPLLALRGVVWFPRVGFTLFVGSEVNLRVIAAAMANRGRFAAFTLKDDRSRRPTTRAELFDMGVMATVQSTYRLPDGHIKLTVSGGERVLVESEVVDRDGIPTIEVTPVEAETFPAPPNYVQIVEDFARRAPVLRSLLSDDEFRSLPGLGEPGHLADLIGARLAAVPFGARQALLQTLDPWQRLEEATELMGTLSPPAMDIDEASEAIAEWLKTRQK
jgi:ATP-dependent Lon protease